MDGVPSIVADDSFSRSIASVVSLLKDKFGEKMILETSGTEKRFSMEDDTRVPFGISVSLTRKFQLISDIARQERDSALMERDSALVERDTAWAERERLSSRIEEILSSRSWRLASKLANLARNHPRLAGILKSIKDRI